MSKHKRHQKPISSHSNSNNNNNKTKYLKTLNESLLRWQSLQLAHIYLHNTWKWKNFCDLNRMQALFCDCLMIARFHNAWMLDDDGYRMGFSFFFSSSTYSNIPRGICNTNGEITVFLFEWKPINLRHLSWKNCWNINKSGIYW